ncbi:Planctomycete cytochrome C [Polystyrenella longa]|uniref:Planctomycete cytochrome C n=1 Tax=Polystyrenella longa TaxID=2528007 RepID=A0A518CMF3_9PLAN|nr:DUF1553 domain-containing protein [Polystyrenella longa]QDU80411.1 Planctomycete cytochrome C [Polystyrenella longa]
MTLNLSTVLKLHALVLAILASNVLWNQQVCADEAVGGETSPAKAKAGIEFFEARIRPILIKHCYECHSSETDGLQAGLYLDSRDGLLEGGDTGPAIVPGNPKESLLLQTLHYSDDTYQMPPSGKLPANIIADFQKWIELGAPDPRKREGEKPKSGVDLESAKGFWSFQAPQKHEPPTVQKEEWIQRPIDSFVLAKLEESNLTPANAADRRTLIRRTYLDLIGMPPSPAQVDAFLADESDRAFEKVVDELLSSPRYGERWGRHWLDVVRYAEDNTNMGPHNGPYEHAWRYRDWVIQALNEDVPYDQFLIRQLATDFLPETGPEDLPALGLLGIGPQNHKEVALAQVVLENRFADDWEDRVDIVGRGLQGLTLACARCHDHKYDPISVEDYYGLASVFASVRQTTRPIISEEEIAKTQPARDQVAEFEKQIKTAQVELKEIAEKLKMADDATKATLSTRKGELEATVKQQQTEIKTIKDSTPGFVIPVANSLSEETIRVEEITPEKMKLEFYDKPRDLNIFVRGDAGNLGEPVSRRYLEVLAEEEPKPFTKGSGRLELARAIASPENPLTARVIVNRVWKQHFGEGLVDTPSNFGTLGSQPSHPELLDDLTVRFIEAGWSLKWLHREILLSATWQQSSESNNSPEQQNSDPANRLLSHFNRRRLEVESYRDSMLAVSGLYDDSMGGKSVDPTDPMNGRRTVYSEISRHKLNGLLAAFDYPDPGLHCAARSQTTTPLQQLFVMNSPFIRKQVDALYARLKTEANRDDTRAGMNWAYQVLYGRSPSEEELTLGQQYVEQLIEQLRNRPSEFNAPPSFAGNRVTAELADFGDVYSVEMLVWNGLPNEARPITAYFFSRGEQLKAGCPGDHLGIIGNHQGGANKGKLIFFNGDQHRESLYGKTMLKPETWNHVVLVREGTRVSVYLNGNPEPEIQGELKTTTATEETKYFFGGRSDGFANLEGKLSDLSVYPHPLSPSDVISHYQSSGCQNGMFEPAVDYGQVVLSSAPSVYLQLRTDYPDSARAEDLSPAKLHGIYEGRTEIVEEEGMAWKRYLHALLISNEMLYYD